MLNKLLQSYRRSFDVTEDFKVGDVSYDAYAKFNVTGTKYVLIKKAELWRAHCFEHTFFLKSDSLSVDTLNTFAKQVTEIIEPVFVREGARYPVPDHMYTYVTGIFISESAVTDEVRKFIRKYHYLKNYLLSVRGYCESRIVLFDLESGKVYGNPAARLLIKGYKKIDLA